MRIVLPCQNFPNIGSQFAFVRIAKFLLLFIFLSTFVTQIQAQHDLEIASISDVDSAGIGDEVTFTITLYNKGGTVLSGVMVKDALPANMTYVSAMPAIGNYSSSTGIWDLTSSFTDSVKLILKARIETAGVHYNVAEVYAMDGFDVDSEPNDGIITDDDYTSSCVSIPFKICTNFNDTIVLTAPTGHDGYQWALDGIDIVGATSQIYKATQPGEYTFIADNISTNCSGGSCCPIEIENACFDLALDKKLATSQTSDIVSPGDDVTYTITVHNQGDYYADSIEIKDYIPAGMVNNTNQWAGNDTLLTIADGQLAPDGLAPNATFTVDITLTVSSPTSVDSLLNYAEISSARDASGTDSRDIDSTPDATNSDPGGASNSDADDYVDGDGQGTIGDGVASTDEDDHDVEVIYICPTITNPTADFAICAGSSLSDLTVNTNTTDDIDFVYFSSAQSGNNMYSGGMSLGSVSPSGGMATITPVGGPITAGTYYIYAIIDTDIDNGNCQPFEEIVLTVNPDPTLVVTDPAAVCAGTVDVTSASVGSPSGGTLSYYASAADASSETSPLTGAAITAVSSTSTIHVRYELSTGCFVLDEIEVTVNPDPTVVVASNTPCEGDALNLTESGNGTGWSWTGPNSFTAVVQNPTISDVTAAAAGRYYVTVTNGNSCSKLDSIDVVINPLPTLTLEVTDDIICSGGTARIEVVNPEAGVTYQLVRAGGTMGTPISDVGMGVAFTLTGLIDTVTYLIEVVNGNGCKDTLNDPAIINVPDCDFGDLPDASITGLSPDYETTLADNGPYHYIIPMLSLGDDIDGESDATPDGMAKGDDDDAIPDDEDGITFFSSLNIVPGGTIKLPIDVVNGTGTTAYLEGWIDWNGDGFLDAGEIIVDIDDSTTPFPAFITVAVPNTIADNVPIGVRFRLSHTPDMTPYGKAESGEIEDYLIQIDCATGICIPISSIIKRDTKD